MSKEVKFVFYEIDAKLKDNLMDFELKNYFEKPLDFKNSLLQIGNYKAYLNKFDDNIYIFQKFKKDFLPKIGDDNGHYRTIDLKDNEYIIEENGVLIDFDNNLVIFHKNQAGFSSSALEEYFRMLLKDKLEYFILKPILMGDTLNKLKYSPIIKQINYKVGRVNARTLSQLGFNEEEIKKFIDLDATNGIEIIIKSKRNMAISTLDKMREFLNFDIFDKLRVKAASSYEASGEEIDILDNILSISRKIKTENKRADIYDIISKLRELYGEFLPQIKKE